MLLQLWWKPAFIVHARLLHYLFNQSKYHVCPLSNWIFHQASHQLARLSLTLSLSFMSTYVNKTTISHSRYYSNTRQGKKIQLCDKNATTLSITSLRCCNKKIQHGYIRRCCLLRISYHVCELFPANRRKKYIIKIKLHSSCEIEYFVETHLRKLCVILRSRVLRVVCPH